MGHQADFLVQKVRPWRWGQGSWSLRRQEIDL